VCWIVCYQINIFSNCLEFSFLIVCSFVITYRDKCSNNCVLVCKKLYVSSLFFELNSPVGTYVVSDLAQ
jgi:hypothetical protein